MKITRISIIVIILIIVSYEIASVIYRGLQWHSHFMGIAVPENLMVTLYEDQFSLHIEKSTLSSLGGSVDKSKARNSYNYLFRHLDNDVKENIIIGYLDHTNYFTPETVVFDTVNTYSGNRWDLKAHNIGEDWGWQFSYPLFVFNSRVVPHSGKLIINGLHIDSSLTIKHKYTQEYRYVGNFTEIGFCVKDDSWLIKNIPIIFEPYQPQYGSLSFFITPGKEIAYMIFYISDGTKAQYYNHFKQIEPALNSIKIHGFYDEDRTDI